MDEKVYEPEVMQETPFPGEAIVVPSESQSSTSELQTPVSTKEQVFPERKIAHELLATALNTRSKKVLQEFELTQSGGFKIGDYKSGVSGELSITPNGLTAKNRSGLITIVIDGDTGDAIFRGTLQTGALISGLVAVGNNSIVIDGEARRMLWYDDNNIPNILIGNG